MSGGTWDTTEDAHEVLARGEETFVLMTAKEGMPISRFRTNIANLDGLRWFRERFNQTMDSLEKGLRDDSL